MWTSRLQCWIIMPGSIRKVSKQPGRKVYQRNWTNCTIQQRKVRCARFSIILLRAPCSRHPQYLPYQSKSNRRHDLHYRILAIRAILRLSTANVFILCVWILLLCASGQRSGWQNRPNVTASPCIYLCNAGHFKSKRHVVWEYKRHRKLIVPEISQNIGKYFPMRSGPAGFVGSTYILWRPGLTRLQENLSLRLRYR